MNIVLALVMIFTLSAYGLCALATAVNLWRTIIESSSWFGKEEETVDTGTEYIETPATKPRYDVDAFRKRMKDLADSMDEDGLFEYTFEVVPDENTGIEVITTEYEVLKDRR
ncbi:MAG: hypothetical protein IJ297_03735 [Clostridia bacterium]|nr:hypothetical protein [Clostridia bacterium]